MIKTSIMITVDERGTHCRIKCPKCLSTPIVSSYWTNRGVRFNPHNFLRHYIQHDANNDKTTTTSVSASNDISAVMHELQNLSANVSSNVFC